MPADSGEVHSAAEEGDEHREEEVSEAARSPDERPVGTNGSRRSRRGHEDSTVYRFGQSDFSHEFAVWFQVEAASRESHGK